MLVQRGQKEQKWNSETNTICDLYFVFSTETFRKNFYQFHPYGCFRIFLLLAHLLKATALSRRKTKRTKIKMKRVKGFHYTTGKRILKKKLRLVTSGEETIKRKPSLKNLLSLFDRLNLPPKFFEAWLEITRQFIKTGTPYSSFHDYLPDN